jgi:hypothetical protein
MASAITQQDRPAGSPTFMQIFTHLKLRSFFDRNPVGPLTKSPTTWSVERDGDGGVVTIFGVFTLIGIMVVLARLNLTLALVVFACCRSCWQRPWCSGHPRIACFMTPRAGPA